MTRMQQLHAREDAEANSRMGILPILCYVVVLYVLGLAFVAWRWW